MKNPAIEAPALRRWSFVCQPATAPSFLSHRMNYIQSEKSKQHDSYRPAHKTPAVVVEALIAGFHEIIQ